MANEMRDRLIKDLRVSKTEWLEKECDHETDKELVEYVADYLLDDAWIRLPCRSGDYVKWDNGIDYKLKEVKGFIFNNSPEKHLRQRLILEDCQPIFSHEGILGYMPKAEAEQKLKEMRGE